MAEDMSNLMNQINNMIKNNQIPQEIQNMMANFSNNSNQEKDNNMQSNYKEMQSDDMSSQTQNSSGSNEIPEFNIATIMKIKKVMESMNFNKDDPRANLLRSLKPYLKDSRKSKIDQYIQVFSMGKAFEMFNSLGGDTKK